MRVSPWFALVWSPLLLAIDNHAFGETFKIASFSDARGYRYFLGTTLVAGGNANIEGYDWYSTMRNWLTTPEVFGPGVAVTLHEISDARTDLAGQGFNLLIMNEVVPLEGSGAEEEAAAIAQFVLGGGCLVIWADTLQGGQGVVMGNKTLAASDGGSGSGGAGRYGPVILSGPQASDAGHFTLNSGVDSNLIWGGGFNYQVDGTSEPDPFAIAKDDVLDNARFGSTAHVSLTPGQWGRVIGKRTCSFGPSPGLSPIIVEIPGEAIDAGLSHSGAGNVLVVGDTIFANDMVYPIAPGFHVDCRELPVSPRLGANRAVGRTRHSCVNQTGRLPGVREKNHEMRTSKQAPLSQAFGRFDVRVDLVDLAAGDRHCRCSVGGAERPDL